MATGNVKVWMSERGFGFVTLDDGSDDLFLHIKEVQGQPDALAIGDKVEFGIGTGRDGRPCAITARLIEQ